MVLRLLLAAVLVWGVGCVGPAGPEPLEQERVHTAAQPLLAAHDRLDEYAEAVGDGDHARARALWPAVREHVQRVVTDYETAGGSLGPAERSALVGYVGGLRAGLRAWDDVDAAIGAGPAGAAEFEDRVATAREHMRLLDRLRAAFGERRASLAGAR